MSRQESKSLLIKGGHVIDPAAKINAPMDVLLREETGLPVTLADDPLTAVVMGAGKVLDELTLLRDVTVD